MVTRKSKTKKSPPSRRKIDRPGRAKPTSQPATVHIDTMARKSERDAHKQIALSVLEQFRLIFRSAKKHFKWVQERTGVSGAQLWVLAELRRKPGIRVTELAHAMAVHQSTASNLIDRLEKNGLIHRDRSGADHRVVELTLTKSGRETIARAPLPLEGVLPDALHSLAHDELVDLQQRLEKLAKLMKVRDRAGKRVPLAEM